MMARQLHADELDRLGSKLKTLAAHALDGGDLDPEYATIVTINLEDFDKRADGLSIARLRSLRRLALSIHEMAAVEERAYGDRQRGPSHRLWHRLPEWLQSTILAYPIAETTLLRKHRIVTILKRAEAIETSLRRNSGNEGIP